MKNILGHTKNLKLFGSSGEVRYFYYSDSEKIVETYYTELGDVEKTLTIIGKIIK